MTRFSSDWLDRREAHDRRARNQDVLAAVGARFAAEPSISVVDLACGTGATVRAVTGALPARQRWRLADNDLGLLARTKDQPPPGVTLAIMVVDLARDLEAALDGPVDLVTTSAFLDLVSEDWLERLVTEIAVRRLPFYAALSYDGRVEMEPADEADAAIVETFNRHQTTDKGFGPALGPAGAARAIELFGRVGYQVLQGTSDWRIEAGDSVHSDLLNGYAATARTLVGPIEPIEIDGWIARRKQHLAAKRATLRVGHVDFFARPTTRR